MLQLGSGELIWSWARSVFIVVVYRLVVRLHRFVTFPKFFTGSQNQYFCWSGIDKDLLKWDLDWCFVAWTLLC